MNISVTSVIESPLSSRQPEETRDESTLKVTPVGSLCDKLVKQWSSSENNTTPPAGVRPHQYHHLHQNLNQQQQYDLIWNSKYATLDFSPAEDLKNLMALQFYIQVAAAWIYGILNSPLSPLYSRKISTIWISPIWISTIWISTIWISSIWISAIGISAIYGIFNLSLSPLYPRRISTISHL